MVVAHICHHINCFDIQLFIFSVDHLARRVDLVDQLPWEFAHCLAQVVNMSDLGDEGYVAGGCGSFSFFGLESR